jgi:hypothetical protein
VQSANWCWSWEGAGSNGGSQTQAGAQMKEKISKDSEKGPSLDHLVDYETWEQRGGKTWNALSPFHPLSGHPHLVCLGEAVSATVCECCHHSNSRAENVVKL